MSEHKCGYFTTATSVCLRTVQAVIHYAAEGERRFERGCKDHYAKIVARIQQSGHEIVEVSSDCCQPEPGANAGCCHEVVGR